MPLVAAFFDEDEDEEAFKEEVLGVADEFPDLNIWTKSNSTHAGNEWSLQTDTMPQSEFDAINRGRKAKHFFTFLNFF